MRVSYGKVWEELGRQHYGAFEKMFERYPEPASITPEFCASGIDFDIHTGLMIRCYFGGRNDPLAEKYIRRGQRIADAVLAADLFQQPPAVHVFPSNRALTWQAKAFADAITRDVRLDRESCSNHAADIAEYSRTIPKNNKWDAYPQNMYQEAIEALLLADAPEEAEKLIASARSMRGMLVKERFAFSKTLFKVQHYPLEDQALEEQYLRIFDIIRNPQFPDATKAFPVSMFCRLGLAALYLKYFRSHDGAYSWSQAFELVCH